jgi:hypothetical protein
VRTSPVVRWTLPRPTPPRRRRAAAVGHSRAGLGAGLEREQRGGSRGRTEVDRARCEVLRQRQAEDAGTGSSTGRSPRVPARRAKRWLTNFRLAHAGSAARRRRRRPRAPRRDHRRKWAAYEQRERCSSAGGEERRQARPAAPSRCPSCSEPARERLEQRVVHESRRKRQGRFRPKSGQAQGDDGLQP